MVFISNINRNYVQGDRGNTSATYIKIARKAAKKFAKEWGNVGGEARYTTGLDRATSKMYIDIRKILFIILFCALN